MATIFTPYLENAEDKEATEKLLVTAFHKEGFNIHQFSNGELQAACDAALKIINSSRGCQPEDLIQELIYRWNLLLKYRN